jgi:hypothetical protein
MRVPLTAATIVVLGCSPEPRIGGSGAQDDFSPIAVGENVLVSRANPSWEHTEYMGDAHPSDPDKLMLCSMLFSQERDRLTSGIYLSSDGGKSWEFTYNDTTSVIGGVWDPACAFGLGIDAFLLTLRSSDDEARDPEAGSYEAWGREGSSGMPLYRSADGGRTWSGPLELGFIDNQDISIDRTGGPNHGRIYVYGNTDPKTRLWHIYSDDGGRSFQRSRPTDVEGYEAWAITGPGTILPDGTLLRSYYLVKDPEAGFTDPGYYTLAVAASTSGGEETGGPVEIDPLSYCASVRETTEGLAYRGAGAVTPVMASDHSGGPFHGRAYVVWGEQFRGHCAVFLAFSDDNGQTWSSPVKVSDELPRPEEDSGPDAFLAMVSVNTNGTVGATWYDRREDPRNLDHRLRFSASLDGGESWLPSVPVSDERFVFKDPAEYPAGGYVRGGGRRARDPTDHFQVNVWPGPRLYRGMNSGMGDYAAVAAGADGRFHAFWIDNRTGVAQMYTAAITVNEEPALHGSPELAQMNNVSSFLEMQSTSSVWDAATQTLTVEYRFLNTSEETVAGPLIMRITRLRSDLGRPVLRGAGIRQRGTGAVVDLDGLIPEAGLAPGQTSGTKRISIGFDPFNDVMVYRTWRHMIDYRAEVFAPTAGD